MLLLCLLALLLPAAPAARAEGPVIQQKPVQPSGAIVVPETFLRRWDPVTLFFDKPVGADRGPYEPDPGELAGMTPEHPGAWRWLDGRTLQFRPAEPWPPLQDFTWRIGDRKHELTTLMAAATDSTPADGDRDLAAIETITLTFPDPVAIEVLAEMVRIDLKALPGIGDEVLRTLDDNDFTITALERGTRGDPARYRLHLAEPIPEGRRALVRLRLNLADGLEASVQTLDLRTRAPFRVTRFGCAGEQRAATRDGARYPPEGLIHCPHTNRTIEVGFSGEVEAIDGVLGSRLVRFEPRVENLTYETAGNRLRVSGDFASATRYRLSLHPSAVRDRHGRTLDLDGINSLYFAFEQPDPFLTINRGDARAVMERFGPRMLPLRGRGEPRVDLRIHAIDPLDTRFWPFPDRLVAVDDDARPPGPGEEPAAGRLLERSRVAPAIHSLGSPSLSEIVDLPLDAATDTNPARFGLDLAEHFTRIAGPQAPGTYLVGLRRIGTDDAREWVRVQVTDLALSVIEDEGHVRFVVTSLASGEPVAGAQVTIERAYRREQWRTLDSGTTDEEGAHTWIPVATSSSIRGQPARIVVRAGADTLVIDVQGDPPKEYADGHFRQRGHWLSWTGRTGSSPRQRPEPAWHCHLFTERPVYRPGDPVEIGGYLRRIHRGLIRRADARLVLVVYGPDGSEWREPLDLTEGGGFHHRFEADSDATGAYRAELRLRRADGDRIRGDQACDDVTFRKEDFRLPRFEVRLDAPGRVELDRPFEVKLDSHYYAGGKVQDRPVRWRVTQFPYHWQPATRPGYFYSSDTRYSNLGAFKGRSTLTRQTRTDEQGHSRITLDPTREPSAQARRYIVEATVSGSDDQTVTDTAEIRALPPFALGLKMPRYLQDAEHLEGSFLVAGIDGDLLAGQRVTARLTRRHWAARLQASDFAAGEPKYKTEVIDELLTEEVFDSTAEPTEFRFDLAGTGVYVLELEARDALGRRQSVEIDLFNDAEGRATWPDPPAETFKVAPERERYAPGEEAVLILESPFAEGRALAIVEHPDGDNRYEWVDVRDGHGRFTLPIEAHYMPGIPVHFLLLRGRLDDRDATASAGLDLAKPATVVASTTVQVDTSAHTVDIDLDFAERVEPGEEVEMTVALRDETGAPVAGEVALWLVDQAVLALGEEQRLDPLPDFIRARGARTRLRDTRNRTIGYLPFDRDPGGAVADVARAAAAEQILDQVTLREDFQAVPYFEPALRVGDDGTATVRITMPDNLTNFMVRAKAASGDRRFGSATGRIAVRLPVIVQPSLPRFLRYGDEAELAAVSRIVEGPTGAGRAQIAATGVDLEGPADIGFDWSASGERRLDFPARVPIPTAWPLAADEQPTAEIRVGVRRVADGAGDGFRVALPVLPDRRPESRRLLERIGPDETVTLPAIDAPYRAGTLRRDLLLSSEVGLVEMAAGLNFLLGYPHGGTEHRISRARGLLGARAFLERTQSRIEPDTIDRHVRTTLDYLGEGLRADGTVGHWPGSRRGNIALTAWAFMFVIEAEHAGYTIDEALKSRLAQALRVALRGDHQHYLDRYSERVWALTALAHGERLESGHAAELARRAHFLHTESLAQVLYALAQESDPSPARLTELSEQLFERFIFRLREGGRVYGGLQSLHGPPSPQILPSETRTVAQALRAQSALADARDDLPRDDLHGDEALLADVLIRLGRGDGWGTTNANTEAVLALHDHLLAAARAQGEAIEIGMTGDATAQQVTLGSDQRLAQLALDDDGAIVLGRRSNAGGGDDTGNDSGQGAGDDTGEGTGEPPEDSVAVLEDLHYVAATSGAEAEARAEGFVVERELRLIDGESGHTERTIELSGDMGAIELATGRIIEERIRVITPEERHHVAVIAPLAAGIEPLNPELDGAPPEAEPTPVQAQTPAYVSYRDDQVGFYYETLEAGTHEFSFRGRVQVPGRFTQPPAYAELMYAQGTFGRSFGARLIVVRAGDRITLLLPGCGLPQEVDPALRGRLAAVTTTCGQ